MTYEGAHSIIWSVLKDLGATATQVGIIAGLGRMYCCRVAACSRDDSRIARGLWTLTTLGYFLNLVVVPGLAFAGN